MVEVMRANDILAVSSMSSSDPDDWLARDFDVECPVYLLVHPASFTSSTASRSRCRWSVAWPVGAGSVNERKLTAWRHIQLEACADTFSAEGEMHYGYFGAITKSAGPEVVAASRYELGKTNLANRREIERLARETPVLDAEENDGWSCQDWVKDLIERMVAAGIVSAAICNGAVSRAVLSGGEPAPDYRSDSVPC